MKRLIPFILLLTFTSCATILNRNKTDVTVYSKRPIKIMVENDPNIYFTSNIDSPYQTDPSGLFTQLKLSSNNSSLLYDTTHYNYKSQFLAKRQIKPLKLRVYYPDSTQYVHQIKPTPTPTIWLNYCTFFMGALVDLSNSKGYCYPEIYIDRSNLQKFEFGQKGDWGLSLSLPTINNIRHEQLVTSGFGLISVALNHNYRDNRFLQARYALESGIFGEPFGSFDRNTTYSLSITDNYRYNNLTFGFGLSCMRYNTYSFYEFETNSPMAIRESCITTELNTTSLGFHMNTYFWFSKVCSLGIVYQPSFLNVTTSTRLSYQHLISLDLAFRIPLYRKKK